MATIMFPTPAYWEAFEAVAKPSSRFPVAILLEDEEDSCILSLDIFKRHVQEIYTNWRWTLEI